MIKIIFIQAQHFNAWEIMLFKQAVKRRANYKCMYFGILTCFELKYLSVYSSAFVLFPFSHKTASCVLSSLLILLHFIWCALACICPQNICPSGPSSAFHHLLLILLLWFSQLPKPQIEKMLCINKFHPCLYMVIMQWRWDFRIPSKVWKMEWKS